MKQQSAMDKPSVMSVLHKTFCCLKCGKALRAFVMLEPENVSKAATFRDQLLRCGSSPDAIMKEFYSM